MLQRDMNAPGKVHDTVGGLPEQCFSILPSHPGQIIGIKRGVIGYVPCGIRDDAPEIVARLNEGLTPAQVAAMEAGSMWGWDVPGADPRNYHADGRPMTSAEREERDNAERVNGGWPTKTQHTPGPWAVKEYNNGRTGEYGLHGVFQQTEKGSQHTPIVEKVWGETLEQSDANARLIAAAPDLLAALMRIRDARDHYAEHGEYPGGRDAPGGYPDGCFDDWAADLAEEAIGKAVRS